MPRFGQARHASYEMLTEEQREFYADLTPAQQERYLATLPEKRRAGASKAKKLDALETRLAIANELGIEAEAYKERISRLVDLLQRDELKAIDVNLKDSLQLPQVEGLALRIVRGPRVSSNGADAEEGAAPKKPRKKKGEAVAA